MLTNSTPPWQAEQVNNYLSKFSSNLASGYATQGSRTISSSSSSSSSSSDSGSSSTGSVVVVVVVGAVKVVAVVVYWLW